METETTHMKSAGEPGDACAMVIFGASGDLTKRKLIPALYNLAKDNLLSREFALTGCARPEMSHEQFRDKCTEELKQFATGQVDPDVWHWFVRRLYYLSGDFSDPAAHQNLTAPLLGVAGHAVIIYFSYSHCLTAMEPPVSFDANAGLGSVDMAFNYADYFNATPQTGYERLLYDCMLGDTRPYSSDPIWWKRRGTWWRRFRMFGERWSPGSFRTTPPVPGDLRKPMNFWSRMAGIGTTRRPFDRTSMRPAAGVP